MGYEVKTIQQEIYCSEKRTEKSIFRYEWKHGDKGWWIVREHYHVDSPFPDRSEMWIPDEIVDHITSFNAKEKLNSE